MTDKVKLIEDDDDKEEIQLKVEEDDLVIDDTQRGRKKPNKTTQKEKKARVLFESTEPSKQKSHVRKNTMRSADLTDEDLKTREEFIGLEEIWEEVEVQKSVMHSTWLVSLIIVLILSVVGAVTWSLTRVNEGDGCREERGRSQMEKEREHQLEIAKEKAQDNSFKEIISGYFTGETLEEKAAFCRNPEETLIAMKKHYAGEEVEISEVTDFGLATVEFIQGQEIRLWNVLLKGEKVRIPLILARDSEGKYALDWETMVCYQPNSWEDFIKSKNPEPTQFRLHIENRGDAGFYGYEFSDDSKYVSFKVYLRDKPEQYLWAYTEKGSDVDKTMQKYTRNCKAVSTMILKLRFLENSQSDDLVLIEEVVSPTWFKSDK